jgi:prepilin-type processing-associated H-X9-DG protein
MVMDDEFDSIRPKDAPGGRKNNRGCMWGCGILLAGFLLLGLVLPLSRGGREGARRAQCTNNLKQIALALHNYQEAEGCFPPAATTDPEGRPLLSWRVLILPYLGEDKNLIARFHLDEPWDSPDNRALLVDMPSTYICPSNLDGQPGETAYLALVGKSAAFTPDFRPMTLADFPDGQANSVLVAEARRHVPWTKPDDVAIGPGDLGDLLGSSHPNGFQAAFVDGSVRFLKSSVEAEVLRALSTRNGHEELRADQY